MTSYNWFLIHHGDGRCGSKVCSGSHSSGVCDSPRVTPRSYLTKSGASTMTWSPQLYLTKSGDEIIGFWSLDSVPDVSETMWGVV